MILKQFFDDTSPLYFIFMKLDTVYKLADIKEKILTEERKSWYLQVIEKLMHLYHVWHNIVFSVYKLAQFLSCSYLVYKSTF